MTPLELEILIWLHTRGDFKEFQNHHLRPQQEAIRGFTALGLCYPDATGLTEKGRAWLSCILATPVPEERFVDPRTNEVINYG